MQAFLMLGYLANQYVPPVPKQDLKCTMPLLQALHYVQFGVDSLLICQSEDSTSISIAAIFSNYSAI